MTNQRWKELSESPDLDLDASEVAEGWHWCVEFDGLLAGPGSSELQFCKCWNPQHPVYNTIPPEPEFPPFTQPNSII